MLLSRLPVKPGIFFLFALTSLAVGCLIPAFYDWTGSNQSRASPIVGRTAIGLLVVALAICVALAWLPSENDLPATCHRAKFRFNIRTILIVTAATAVFAALVQASILPLLGVTSYLVALAFAVHFWIAFRPFRGRLLSLLACMYLPFAWVVSLGQIPKGLEVILLAIGLPTLLPTVYISSVVQRHAEQMSWLGAVLTSLELLGGLWLVRCDRRLAIAYHLFALLLSMLGSFALNALLRM